MSKSEDGPTIVITQNGEPAAVLAPEELDRLTSEARFVAAVQEGLADLDAGSLVSDAELGRRLDARFGRVKCKR